jgi:uncharacterized protein YndB with AHSA1/START domain
MRLALTGEVLDVDPPRRLSFTWGEETLRFELSGPAGVAPLTRGVSPPPDTGCPGWRRRLRGVTLGHATWT